MVPSGQVRIVPPRPGSEAVGLCKVIHEKNGYDPRFRLWMRHLVSARTYLRGLKARTRPVCARTSVGSWEFLLFREQQGTEERVLAASVGCIPRPRGPEGKAGGVGDGRRGEDDQGGRGGGGVGSASRCHSLITTMLVACSPTRSNHTVASSFPYQSVPQARIPSTSAA